jgi:uncharacterized Zn ribbon protein
MTGETDPDHWFKVARKWASIALGISKSKVTALQRLAEIDGLVQQAEPLEPTPMVGTHARPIITKTKTCTGCQTEFVPDHGRRLMCEACRATKTLEPKVRETSRLPKMCGRCLQEFIPTGHKQLMCEGCKTAVLEELEAEEKALRDDNLVIRDTVACADCVHAKPSEHSYCGFECTIYKHQQCFPIGYAKFFQPKTEPANPPSAQTSPTA